LHSTRVIELEDPLQALERRAAEVDLLVLEQYGRLPVTAGWAVVAVGGYGRRQLFPASDVDLLLLFETQRLAENLKTGLSLLLQQLWDAGLRVSHSVRTPPECCGLDESNLELSISLLDQRFLTGDPAIYDRLASQFPRFVHGQRDRLVRRLSALTRERRQRFGDTIYHLEPDIKEAPGGLRDLHLVCWLDQIQRTTASELARHEAPAELEPARRFLFEVRSRLHRAAGRDNNQLTYAQQDGLAEEWLGIEPAGLMREYFRCAREVYRAASRRLEAGEARASSLFSQFRDWRSRLSNAEFTVARDRIYFRIPQQLEADPELALRLFQFVARHGIRISEDAEQRFAARLPELAAWFAHSRDLWPALSELLALPHAHLALRAMHETGFLQALFPELEATDCLVVRDFYHRYTVDEHSLVAIQRLASLDGKFAELFSELEKPALLRFALLFHDSGKGSGGDHVEVSARLADLAMRRIRMPAPERETVSFLISAHLEMSAVMTQRDLEDPLTARFLAGKLGAVERLKALTLLTYADISAVHPSAMTAWRAQQLWQLYVLTYHKLTRELDRDRIESADPAAGDAATFLEGFPVRYLRVHSQEAIGEHRELEKTARLRGVAVDLKKERAAWLLTLITQDRPFLFASVAGTLSSFGMNILKAQAFSNRSGFVLDTFTFADPARTLDLNPSEEDRLRLTLERVLVGKLDVARLLDGRPRKPLPSRKSSPSISVAFDSEASQSATLIEITAEDRPGLLYELSAAISAEGCNIEVVLIDTEAHKAIDVFYVTSGGRKLDSSHQLHLQKKLEEIVSVS